MLLANATLPGSRKTGGAWVLGVWTGESSASLGTISGSLQPLTAFQMQTLPEGRRDRASWLFITDADLHTITEQNADILTIDGTEFEVYMTNPWADPLLSHGEYILQQRHPVVPVEVGP